jgi:chorismate dehydratase
MPLNKLIVGKIPYLVCAPFFQNLKNDREIVYQIGHPAELNRSLRESKIDLAPTSSIEYARNSKDYLLLPNICTGGKNGVGSVLLVSNLPIEELDWSQVQCTDASETSIALLKVLFAIRYSKPLNSNEGVASQANLFIGDEALRQGSNSKWPYRYDLAELWYEWNQLPFVFGLWICRKDCLSQKEASLKAFYEDLIQSVGLFNKETSETLQKWEQSFPSGYSSDKWTEYFELLNYEFKEEQKKSLELFYKYCAQIDIAPEGVQLEFLSV